MNPIAWLRWRLRVPRRPTGDSVTDFGRLLAWQQTPDVHRAANRLERERAVPVQRILYSTWVVHSALWPVAAELSGADHATLDRFFRGYWPMVTNELATTLRTSSLLAAFDADVETLVGALRPLSQIPDAAQRPKQCGKILNEYFGSAGAVDDPARWIPLGFQYSATLVAYAEALHRLSKLAA